MRARRVSWPVCPGIALDELAWQLKIDPVELRLRNYAETDPEKGSRIRASICANVIRSGWRRALEGAGANARRCIATDVSSRLGMATSTYPGYRSPGAARVRILRTARSWCRALRQDIGTGLTHHDAGSCRCAGNSIGDNPRGVGRFGTTPAPVSGGSMTTASVTPAVKAAAEDVFFS